MKSRTTMTYAAALATAATLALAGCNGSDKNPTPTPTPSSSTTTSPSPSVSTSPTTTPSASASIDVPAAARSHSQAGAEAFLRFYFEEVNAAYLTPTESTANRLTQISTSTCKSCSAGAADVRSLSRAGQRLAGPAFAPPSDITTQKVTDTNFRISFTMSQTDAKVIGAGGKVVDTQIAKSQSQIAALVWEEGSWHMDGLAAA